MSQEKIVIVASSGGYVTEEALRPVVEFCVNRGSVVLYPSSGNPFRTDRGGITRCTLIGSITIEDIVQAFDLPEAIRVSSSSLSCNDGRTTIYFRSDAEHKIALEKEKIRRAKSNARLERRKAQRKLRADAKDNTIPDIKTRKNHKSVFELASSNTKNHAYTLENRIEDLNAFGLIPDEAMFALRALYMGHTFQRTHDHKFLGGESGLKTAFEMWVQSYKIDGPVAITMTPDNFLKSEEEANAWLKTFAETADLSLQEYVQSRFQDPEKVKNDLDRKRFIDENDAS